MAAAVNLFYLLIAAFLSYAMINAGFEWYYAIPGALFAFGIASTVTQLVSNLFDKVKNPT